MEELYQMGVDPSMTHKPIVDFVCGLRHFWHMPLSKGPQIFLNGLLPQGAKMLVYGTQKIRKSFLALEFALMASEAKDILGLGVPKPAKTLYLQFEISEKQLQERIITPWDNCFVGTTFYFHLHDRQTKERLKTILDVVQPTLVILDPAYKLMRGSIKDDDTVQEALDVIDQYVIEGAQAACILFHHENREGSMLGSGRLFQWPDSIVRMVAENRDDAKLEFELLRHAPEMPEPLRMTFDNDQLLFYPKDETPIGQAKRMIEAGATVAELKQAFPDIPDNTLKQWRQRYKTQGGG